jgi:hypothetical protein
MTKNRWPLLAALLLPALLSSHLPGDRIRFAPSEGSSAKKTFVNKVEFTLDHLSLSINGSAPPAPPEMEMTITSDQKVVVQDEYVANRDGAPKKLVRTFEDLGSSTSMSMKMEMMGQTQNQDQDIKGESELEGKKVVFNWDEDKGEYVKAFDGAEGKEALLKELEEDMDLRVLLPKTEVKEGEQWDIEVEGFASVLAPGGNLSILPKEMDAEQMGMGMPGMGSMTDWLRGSLEGTAKGTFVGMEEKGGAKLARIKIEAKINVAKDMTEMIEEMMKKAKLPPEAQNFSFDHMDIDYKLEADGELVWDLAAGRARSFTLSGPSHANMDMTMKIDAGGQSMNIDYGMELSGNTELSLEVE